MSNPERLSDSLLDAILAQAQNQSLIQAVELMWNALPDLSAVAQKAEAAYQPPLLELATALRAVTAGTPAIDTAALAAALQTANPAWAADAHGTASDVFRGLPGMLPRRFFGDMGNRPAVPNDGVYSSPDLIIAGTSPLSDPSQLLGSWNRDPSVQPQGERANFIYVRGLNLYPGTQAGKVYLYLANGNVVTNPSRWTPLKAVDNRDYALIGSDNTGDVWYTTVPFTWTPPAGQHMCLIARVETTQYPNPLPSGAVDPASWVNNSPAISWRNYDPLAGLLGVRNDVLEFGNPGSSDADFVIAAVARNVPAGVTIRMQSKGNGVNVDTGVVMLSQGRQEVTAQVRLPAGFWGQLQVGINNQGIDRLGPSASIDVRCYRKVAPGSSRYALPAPAQGLRQRQGATGDGRHLELMGSFAFGGNGGLAG